MNCPIVKTFIGKHIDLSKVVSISDAFLVNNLGFGVSYVEFVMDIQLLDQPIHYKRELEDDEYHKDTETYSGYALTMTDERICPECNRLTRIGTVSTKHVGFFRRKTLYQHHYLCLPCGCEWETPWFEKTKN